MLRMGPDLVGRCKGNEQVTSVLAADPCGHSRLLTVETVKLVPPCILVEVHLAFGAKSLLISCREYSSSLKIATVSSSETCTNFC
jgi:hypothetical protein